MRRLAPFLLLVLGLAAPLAARPAGAKKPVRVAAPTSVELAHRFLVPIPAEMQEVGRSIDTVAWEPKKSDAPWGRVAASVRELGNVTSLTPAEARQAVDLIAGRLRQPKVGKMRHVKVADQPGYRLEYQAQSGAVHLRACQWMAVRSGQLLIISLVAPPQAFGRWLPVAEKVVAGARLRGG